MKRYARNQITLSEEENQMLHDAKVCVVGCGGLGGYSIEMLARLGVGTITAIDGDVFDESNLNRQILSDTQNLGESKALTAQKRILSVNPETNLYPVTAFLTPQNAKQLLKDHDVIVDALDSIEARFLIQETAKALQIPFVHGAIAGWYGQVSTIFPGEDTLNKIYKNRNSTGKEKIVGNPAFTPALISAQQVSEVVKILIHRGDLLRKKMLFMNVLDHEYEVLELE
ncbi:HesA/MoeB/ThiF family protein [Cellulosilyticum sp. I15G10I2]|uniref:HesA/MoeB/ThiF family protein n=1 Tax=Cellulosilyticum sp. I15G10I2 TaxID=1892843 RepID=UPI00085C85F2|nr:HesA/MoeB/ThiF family protein [Cellulosilyticum sp. I15G10I2]